MKVLVSGSAGFVGNVLCRQLLDKGYKVKAVDNFYKGPSDGLLELSTNDNFEFQYGDVANKNHIKDMWHGVDACIHLAAIVGFPACDKRPYLAELVNYEGTKNLLEHREGRPFVNASSGSCYGKIQGLCTEDSPLNALNSYGTTKARAEQLVTNDGDNTLSFRFATGFGVSPNMRINLLVNDFVYQALTNGCLNVFQADFKRTFISVKDMGRAFVWGLENISRLNHKVYNCGDNELNWSKRELAEYICDKTGASVSFMETGTDKDQRNYEVSFDRLNNEGFKCNVSMEEGIDELIKTTPLLQITHRYM